MSATSTTGALDAVLATLDDAEALAGLLRDTLAQRPAGPPVWLLTHWVDHPGPGSGAHLALTVEVGGSQGAGPLAGDLRAALEEAVRRGRAAGLVHGGVGEVGLAVQGGLGIGHVDGDSGEQRGVCRAPTRWRSGIGLLREGADAALTAHGARASGRAVIYPGVEAVGGVLTVDELVACTAIDRVAGLAGLELDGSSLVHTFGFARPQWRDGELVLPVVPFAGETFTPFEVRSPTPCCAGH